MTETQMRRTTSEALSVKEVLAISGLGKTTVYKLISSGSIPAKKIGRKTVVLRRDLSIYLDNLPSMLGHRGL